MLRTLRDTVLSAPTLLRTMGQPRKERQRVENFRDSKLRRLVAHAYANVPFYRVTFDEHGVHPRKFRGYGDLPLLPIVTKHDLQRASPDDLLAAGTDTATLRIHGTQGTTGEPLKVSRTFAEARVLRLYFFQAFRSFGLSPRDMSVEIRIPHPAVRRFGPFRRAASAIRFYPRAEIDARALDKVVPQLHRIQPAVIGGWPSILSLVAERCEADGAAFEGLEWPKFLQTGGERLDPSVRRQLEQVFCAPVFDMYSSSELGVMAWQCRRAGVYHTGDETVALEVLLADGSPAAAGATGLFTGTALHSFAAPLIRYRLGDEVTQGSGPCACGAPYATIEAIDGRVMENFTGPDGSLISVYEILEEVGISGPWVRQVQVIRESLDRLTIRVAPLRIPTAEDIEAVRSGLMTYPGPSMRCDVEIADDLGASSSGKFKTLVDKIR